MSIERTAGKLLVATPQITDGLFHRSVVLMLQHDANGAHGVVLNKPFEADVDTILPTWGEHVSAPPRVFHGGPVQLDSALGLVLAPGDGPAPMGVQRLFGAIGVIDLDTPPPVVAGELGAMRVFAGYAGWSPGQLEGELVSGSWWVVDAETADPFGPQPDTLWRRVLRRQPGDLALVAWYPDDPDDN